MSPASRLNFHVIYKPYFSKKFAMTRLATATLLLFSAVACAQKPTPSLPPAAPFPSDSALTTIAFGSCNRQDLPQVIWKDILANDPQLWIWLGDNIYGDTENMEVMKQKYDRQKSGEGYQQLRSNAAIVGIWDDHDYGVNDGDKNYSQKAASKGLMLDFLDVPATAPVRTREGAYQDYTFGPEGKQVKVILLDARYFRDELQKGEGDDSRRYLPNETGDVLGEAQWQWLEETLTQSTAQVHLIGCGIQFLSAEHAFEKWANFPAARKRLLDLLVKTQPAAAILLSGDRHIAEVSKMDLEGLPYPLFDITSSGLTHAYTKASGEPNAYRVGPLVNEKNFGVLRLNWSGEKPAVSVEIRSEGNNLLTRQSLF
jgi:alkaline phosphatase D